jgi:hypothetical protein
VLSVISGHISTRVLRFVLPALLIILVLAGLRGAVTAPSWASRLHHDGIAVGIALEAVLAALLVALLIRERWTGPSTFVAGRLRLLLRYLLGAGLIAIPGLMLFSIHIHLPRFKLRRSQIKGLGKGKPPPFKPPAPFHFPLAAILYGLLVLVLIAGVVVCWRLVTRRDREDDDRDLDFGDETSELGAAVQWGRSALRELDDARAAIIACYVAMESSLARAGAARGVAETPDELLTRAVVSGLASVGAASRLTALFYEARFSTHPLGRGERDEAEQALSEIADTVSRLQAGEGTPAAPAGAGAGSTAGAAGPAGSQP